MNGSCPRFIGFEPDGTVSPFCEMPVEAQYAYGNLHDQDLLDLMTGENARRFTAFLQQGREPCGTCRWTGLCSGGCAFSRLQLAGNPESADPLCPLYKGVFARLEAGLDEALEPDLRLHSA